MKRYNTLRWVRQKTLCVREPYWPQAYILIIRKESLWLEDNELGAHYSRFIENSSLKVQGNAVTLNHASLDKSITSYRTSIFAETFFFWQYLRCTINNVSVTFRIICIFWRHIWSGNHIEAKRNEKSVLSLKREDREYWLVKLQINCQKYKQNYSPLPSVVVFLSDSSSSCSCVWYA